MIKWSNKRKGHWTSSDRIGGNSQDGFYPVLMHRATLSNPETIILNLKCLSAEFPGSLNSLPDECKFYTLSQFPVKDTVGTTRDRGSK